MEQLHTVLTAFLLVFIAELADKTQLAVFSLSATTGKPIKIFFASSIALVCSTVLASLLGRVSAEIIPQFISYVAAGLFIVFGVIMLFKKEAPLIEDCFVKLLSLEEAAKKLTEKENRIAEEVTTQEETHIELLNYLLHHKKFFQDDINREHELTKIYEKLESITDSFQGFSDEQMWEKLMLIEKTAIDFYRFLYLHLERDEHNEESIQQDLVRIIEEEKSHFHFYEKKKDREKGEV